jgi:hypothetical protein
MKTTSTVKQDPWPKIRLRWGRILALVVMLPLLLVYVGSYTYLSRRGMREARMYHFNGFLYVPMEEVLETEDLSQHYRRATFYAPVNWVDRTFFGGDGPVQSILFGLSR